MKVFIIYFIVSLIYEIFALYFAWKSLKKKMAGNPMLTMMKTSFLSLASGKLLKKKIVSIPVISFAVIAFILASPVIFPFSIISKLKKLIFGKSKLEKQVEAEEDAHKKSQEWLKNEGDMLPPFMIEEEK